MGFESEWILGKGWNLFGNASFSMLFSKFCLTQDMIMGSNLTTNPGEGWHLRDSFYQNLPNMQMAVGLAWNYYFCDARYHFSMRSAYEFIEWTDQLQLMKFFSGAPGYAHDTVSRGNLTLNGFSLRAELNI
jgi:hypothetical protein